MNQVFFYFFFLIIIFWNLSFCTETKTFRKIQNKNENIVNFYLIRAADPIMSLYKYKVLLSKFKGSFKTDKSPVLIKKINIGVGEYSFWKLEEGYYKIELEDDSYTQKIFYLEKGKEYFYEFYIFSSSDISLPEYYFRQIEKQNALEILLEGKNHLTRHSDSED